MSPDPYASCPCGSGKKFKWCCQPIFATISHALQQAEAGQHEAALRSLEQAIKEHPANPEPYGHKARLLYAQGQAEQAETALEKAFEINPNYPFGLLLQASFRFHEGELPGALVLARRAADAYDPTARDYLAELSRLIFECEWRRQRPVAARAALRMAVHLQPAEEEMRASFDRLFGEESRLPLSARREYLLKSPAAGIPAPRRAAWDKARKSIGGRLSEPAKAFEALVREAPDDPAALYNLGISRAWIGDNKGALEALDRYLDLEPDELATTDAATLMEVLRCAQGMEEEGDYRQYGLVYQVRNPDAINVLLNEWAQAHRLIIMQTPDSNENVFFALVLELTSGPLLTVGSPGVTAGRLAAYLAIAGNIVQLTSPLKEPFGRVRDEMRTRLAIGIGEMKERVNPISFHDVIAEALLFPIGGGDEEKSAARVLEHAQTHYEDKWIYQPRRVLGGNTPADAAKQPRLRKKLRGVIRFIQECAGSTLISTYDFDRLRNKLGLSTTAAAAAPAGAPAPVDISALGATELAALPMKSLTDEQLEQGYQVAHRLDAPDVTARFAEALVDRPANPARPDRFPWYSFLITKALKEGALDAALDRVNEGEKFDCEQNEGKRRNDYELRRAQVHVKRGEVEPAQDVFQRLIERAPTNFKYRGAAAEAMMTLKQGARALRFAEEGLAAARKANDRDSEEYLMDLAAAAKRQGG